MLLVFFVRQLKGKQVTLTDILSILKKWEIPLPVFPLAKLEIT